MTRPEAILWNYLKQKQIVGQRFLRQFSIDKYIVDFYCQKINLAIEIDGDTHLNKVEKEYDTIRQNEIENLGIIFLRFNNYDIYHGMDNVIHCIKSKVNELMNPPAPLS